MEIAIPYPLKNQKGGTTASLTIRRSRESDSWSVQE
jgi:hypothetical protein